MSRYAAGPFDYFWTRSLLRECPRCLEYAPALFPGDAEPADATCVRCVRDNIQTAFSMASCQLGYSLQRQGPCARCQAPHHLYGYPDGRRGGHPLCDDCRAGGAAAPAEMPVATAKTPAAPQAPLDQRPQPCAVIGCRSAAVTFARRHWPTPAGGYCGLHLPAGSETSRNPAGETSRSNQHDRPQLPR